MWLARLEFVGLWTRSVLFLPLTDTFGGLDQPIGCVLLVALLVRAGSEERWNVMTRIITVARFDLDWASEPVPRPRKFLLKGTERSELFGRVAQRWPFFSCQIFFKKRFKRAKICYAITNPPSVKSTSIDRRITDDLTRIQFTAITHTGEMTVDQAV